MNTPARILLVEDDRFLRKAAQARLRKAGYDVITAVDGADGLAQSRAGSLDLILLDLIMPKMQGFDVLKALKADPHTQAIPVIVMSNLSQESDRDRATHDGAAAYFVKANTSLDGIVDAVRSVLQQRVTA